MGARGWCGVGAGVSMGKGVARRVQRARGAPATMMHMLDSPDVITAPSSFLRAVQRSTNALPARASGGVNNMSVAATSSEKTSSSGGAVFLSMYSRMSRGPPSAGSGVVAAARNLDVTRHASCRHWAEQKTRLRMGASRNCMRANLGMNWFSEKQVVLLQATMPLLTSHSLDRSSSSAGITMPAALRTKMCADTAHPTTGVSIRIAIVSRECSSDMAWRADHQTRPTLELQQHYRL